MPVFGTWKLPGPFIDAPGRFLASFENALLAAIDRWRPSRVVIEAPIRSGSMHGKTNANTLAQQINLWGQTHQACYRENTLVLERASSTVRLTVLGKGGFAEGQAKRVVVAWCHQRGWKVQDDHQADAAALWQYESWLTSPNGTPIKS